jgi:hypothetical protein
VIRRLLETVQSLETGVQGEDLPSLLMDETCDANTGAQHSIQLEEDADTLDVAHVVDLDGLRDPDIIRGVNLDVFQAEAILGAGGILKKALDAGLSLCCAKGPGQGEVVTPVASIALDKELGEGRKVLGGQCLVDLVYNFRSDLVCIDAGWRVDRGILGYGDVHGARHAALMRGDGSYGSHVCTQFRRM